MSIIHIITIVVTLLESLNSFTTLYPTEGINYLSTGGGSIGKYRYKIHKDIPVIVSASVNITHKDLGTGTLPTHNAEKYARNLGFDNDDAGHILANHLGGLGEPINIFPQSSHINRGSYKMFESVIYDCMNYERVEFGLLKWKFSYTKNQTRPKGIEYTAIFKGGDEKCEKLHQKFTN